MSKTHSYKTICTVCKCIKLSKVEDIIQDKDLEKSQDHLKTTIPSEVVEGCILENMSK